MHTAFWYQRHQIPASEGGSEMVHHCMLPLTKQNLDNRYFRCINQGALLGCRTTDGGGPERQPDGAGGRSEGGGYSGSAENGGAQGYAGPLPPTTATMVPGWEDVEHGPGGERGEVPDGLHPRDILSSISECDCPGPTA